MLIIISIKKKSDNYPVVRVLLLQRAEFPFFFISIIHLFSLERVALSFMGEVSSLFHGKVCQHNLYR